MQISKDKSLDSTLALFSEGYNFISNRCRKYQTDVFETRLLGSKAICTMGEEAARMFYHPGRFTRKKALPITVVKSLQDKGSVQMQDGNAHRHRKAMFMNQMKPESMQKLSDLMAEEWKASIEKWEHMDKIQLYTEMHGILCRAAC